MGQRANYVIVEDDGYALYYSHWSANTLDRDLFWGPEPAIDFVRQQAPREPGQWLDQIWAEGGALLNPEMRHLILFGGEDVNWDVPLRRLYLTLLEGAWPGWDIAWAHEGLVNFTDYLGLERSLVMAEEQPTHAAPPRIAKDAPPETICSLRGADGRLTLYPLERYVESVRDLGPRLIGHLEALPGAKDLEADLTDGDCQAGLHVDVAARSVALWQAGGAPDIHRRMAELWPEWSFTWHRDRFEQQVALTESRLTFTEPSRTALLERLSHRLLEERDGSPAAAMAGLTAGLERRGERVEINPDALIHAPQEFPEHERRQLFERSVARLPTPS